MKYVIRTDSSSAIGSGHLMRCLTLAESLRRAGESIIFISRDLPGNLGHLVEKAGYRIHMLRHSGPRDDFDETDDLQMTMGLIKAEAPVDWLIVDCYTLDDRWEKPLRDYVGHILVIDDLADRKHDCDLLLDQNLYPGGDTRYDDRLPDHCRQLIGPKYALLRPEFASAREHMRKRDGSINRLLISMGGADPHNLTSQALQAAATLNTPELAVDVVIGAANPYVNEIKEIAHNLPYAAIHHPARNMAALMAGADLCIGTSGSTTWERCCLGLPNLFIAAGDNELEIARSAETAGIGKFLGRHDEVWPEMIADELRALFNRPDLIRSWSATGAALVDGQGAERVCRAVIEFIPTGVQP